MISIRNLTKVYKLGSSEIIVLNNVTFDVSEGEFISIMGPSGSGKSTLLHLIGCLDKPTSGKIYIDGLDISDLSDTNLAKLRNKKIGFIFQMFNLLSRLNVLENVELPLIYRNVPKPQRQKLSMECLSKVGLENRIFHRPNKLSGGEMQRVAIARALVNDPSIILADEPTGNLDTKTGLEIMEIFKGLNSEGQTIVLVTHNPEMTKSADRVLHLKDGKINEST